MRITDAEWADLQARMQSWRESLDPTPDPEPEPEPEPTPTTEKVVLLGSAVAGEQYRVGPADRASLATLEAAIAATPVWSVFADEFEHISPSRNGVRATEFVKLHVWGNMNGLYKQIPGVDGPVYPVSHSSDLAFAAGRLREDGTKAGKRGEAVMTPYTTWHGHTRVKADGTISMSQHIPMWVGVQLDGWVVYAMRDGSFVKAFQIPDVGATADFTFSEPVKEIFYVIDFVKGLIYKVDRRDWSVVSIPSFVNPTSIREVNGVLYVADSGAIYTLVDGVKTKLLDVPQAFWVDYLSDGRLVVATLQRAVYIIDPANPVLGANLMGSTSSTSWITVSVDRNGTFGPVDEFTVINMGGAGNTDLWRYQDGVMKYKPIPGALGLCTVGTSNFCQNLSGHYPWVGEHHPDEAVLMAQGLTDVFPALIAARPQSYPAGDDGYDSALFFRGTNIIRFGTVSGVEYGTRPSFTCQIAETSWSLIGCSADSIAEKSFADAAAFVQAGMLGSFPRPEIKGLDLLAILYVFYRSSQRFLREGNALIDQLRAFCASLLGQELPAIAQRLPVSGDIHMEVLASGSSMGVQFFWHPYGHAATPEHGLVVRVFVDEGLPEQMDLGEVSAPWTLAIPSLAPGQHSVRCVPVSGFSDLGKYRGRAVVLNG